MVALLQTGVGPTTVPLGGVGSTNVNGPIKVDEVQPDFEIEILA